MKKFISLATALILAAAVHAAAAEFTIKLGHISNSEHTWLLASLKFKELVEKGTNGRVKVEVYPNNEIGSEMEVIDAIHSGVAHMVISADSMANWAPAIAILSVPYMIRDEAHLNKVLASEVGQFIDKQLMEKAAMRPLSVFVRSARNVTSNTPITVPDDMKGMKLRISNVPIHVVAWEAVGAKPIPMAFSEVFTSLQQKVIDGQENPVDLIKSASFYEVQKYVNRTEHVIGWIYLLIGEDYFKTLPKDIQDVIIKAGKETEAYERKLHAADEAKCEKFLTDHGMQFHKADKEAFAKKMQPDVLKALTPELQDLYKKVIAM